MSDAEVTEYTSVLDKLKQLNDKGLGKVAGLIGELHAMAEADELREKAKALREQAEELEAKAAELSPAEEEEDTKPTKRARKAAKKAAPKAKRAARTSKPATSPKAAKKSARKAKPNASAEAKEEDGQRLDAYDRTILKVMENGSLPASEVAEKAGLQQPFAARRLKKLCELGLATKLGDKRSTRYEKA